MNSNGIFGHTFGLVLKKKFFTENEYKKEIETKSRHSRMIKRYKLVPKLRQAKIEFYREFLRIYVFRPLDFTYLNPVSVFDIAFDDIKYAEIKLIGNTNPIRLSKTYKIKFYNEFNEEIFYFNFGAKMDRYLIHRFQVLESLLIANKVKYNIIDESYFV